FPYTTLFRSRGEDARDVRLQDDQVADLDRVEELQIVDRRRHQQAAGVAVARDGAGDVDEVHDGAAQDEAKRVGVVWQYHLHHLGSRRRGAFRCQIHVFYFAAGALQPTLAG